MELKDIIFSPYKKEFSYSGFIVSKIRLDKVVKKGDRVAIFGTATAGEEAYKFCKEIGLNLVCFIDDYKDGFFHSLPIIKREMIDEIGIDIIIIGYGQKGNLDFGNKRILKLHSLRPYTISEQEVNKTLYLTCEYVCSANIEGDIAEFGTNSGRSSVVLATALNSFSTTKRLYCFDSFMGLPKIDSSIDLNHADVKSGIWQEGSFCDLTAFELKDLLSTIIPKDRVTIYEGWFCNTLKLINNIKLSLVHIDSDLYSSAFEVLDYLFGHKIISNGCAILFDDSNCSFASNEFGERRAWREMVKRYKIEFSDGGWYGWAGWRFIVHGYE